MTRWLCVYWAVFHVEIYYLLHFMVKQQCGGHCTLSNVFLRLCKNIWQLLYLLVVTFRLRSFFTRRPSCSWCELHVVTLMRVRSSQCSSPVALISISTTIVFDKSNRLNFKWWILILINYGTSPRRRSKNRWTGHYEGGTI